MASLELTSLVGTVARVVFDALKTARRGKSLLTRVKDRLDLINTKLLPKEEIFRDGYSLQYSQLLRVLEVLAEQVRKAYDQELESIGESRSESAMETGTPFNGKRKLRDRLWPRRRNEGMKVSCTNILSIVDYYRDINTSIYDLDNLIVLLSSAEEFKILVNEYQKQVKGDVPQKDDLALAEEDIDIEAIVWARDGVHGRTRLLENQRETVSIIKLFDRPEKWELGRSVLNGVARELNEIRAVNPENIAEVLGYCTLRTNPVSLCLVCEEYAFSLGSFIKDNPGVSQAVDAYGWMYRWSHGILCGLQKLHDNNLVHGSLSENNVLITKHGRPAVLLWPLGRKQNKSSGKRALPNHDIADFGKVLDLMIGGLDQPERRRTYPQSFFDFKQSCLLLTNNFSVNDALATLRSQRSSVFHDLRGILFSHNRELTELFIKAVRFEHLQHALNAMRNAASSTIVLRKFLVWNMAKESTEEYFKEDVRFEFNLTVLAKRRTQAAAGKVVDFIAGSNCLFALIFVLSDNRASLGDRLIESIQESAHREKRNVIVVNVKDTARVDRRLQLAKTIRGTNVKSFSCEVDLHDSSAVNALIKKLAVALLLDLD